MGWKFEKPGLVKLRNGDKGHVFGVCPFSNRVIGCIVSGDSISWYFDGAAKLNAPHDFDIVAEWVEPKRIKGWVNVQPGCGQHEIGNFHLTRKEADHVASTDRVACIEIDVLEGEGL